MRTIRGSSWLFAVVLALTSGSTRFVAGQGSARTGAIVGVILNDRGGGISSARVEIVSVGRERFTDDHGRFRFDSLPVGAVRLRVGQVGWFPLERTVTVVGANPDTIKLTMSLADIRLAAVKATADSYCGRSWTTARSDTNVTKIFDQLIENAAHNRLLVRESPFHFTMAREVGYLSGQKGDTSLTSVHRDTVQRASTRPWRYAPGRVIDPPPSGDGLGEVTNLLELADVADAPFLDNHCWEYRGIESIGGVRMLRIDVQPAKTLRVADISGSFFLDTTYTLRRSVLYFTRTFSATQSVEQRISVETVFQNLRPGLPIAGQVVTIVDRAVEPQCLNAGVSLVCPAGVRIITRDSERLLGVVMAHDST